MTPKETQNLLIEIKASQLEMAKTHLKFSTTVSIFMNNQQDINTKVLGYLQNDSKTNTKGVVDLSNENKKRLDSLDTKEKVRVGIVSGISLVFGFLGSLLIKLLKQ